MRTALVFSFALTGIGIPLGAVITPAFFVITVVGIVWLAVVGLGALRRATRRAMRPAARRDVKRHSEPDLIRVLSRASGIAATWKTKENRERR